MSQIKASEVKVGQKFVFQGDEFTKTDISYCGSQLDGDYYTEATNEYGDVEYIHPDDMVTILSH